MANIIPCRVTFQGVRYEISKDGSVRRFRPVDVNFSEAELPVSPEFAKDVRAEASRQRRNRNNRERHSVLRSLGMVKTPYGWE